MILKTKNKKSKISKFKLSSRFVQTAKSLAVYGRYAYKVYKCTKEFKKYSNQYDQKILFVAGLPKSGTTWLENILCSYPGFNSILIPQVTQYELAHGGSHHYELPENIFSRFKDMLAVTKMHIHGSQHNAEILQKADIKYVIMYRDLRDVAISYYYYVRQTPWHPEYNIYHSLTLNEGLLEFSRQLLGQYEEWIRSWHKNKHPENSLIVRYEELLYDTKEKVTQIANHFSLDSQPETVSKIIRKNSFEKLSGGRKTGQSDDDSFFRSGICGKWKTEFTSEIKEIYKRKIGDFLIELGYEHNHSW